MGAEVYEPPRSARLLAVILGAISATPVYALMAFSVVLTLMGHIFKDQKIVAIGIALLFLSTALLLLGAYSSYQQHGPVDF
jgi:membrane protease YdiL (CAAX protease family)